MTQINETSAEYVVSTMKHFYDKMIIVQYGIKNTIEDNVLTKVTLSIDGIDTECGVTV